MVHEILRVLSTPLAGIWAAANAQLATQLVALLLLTETASWACVLLSPGTRQRFRIGWLRPTGWALLPCIGFFAVASVATIVPGVAMPVSTIVGGTLLFVVGWMVRYGDLLAGCLLPLVDGSKRRVAWLLRQGHFLQPPVRHPRYLGLLLEAAGLGFLASSAWALALLPVLAAMAYLAVEGQERSLIRAHPDAGGQEYRRQTRALCPGLAQTFQLVRPALAAWTITGVLMGEVHLATTDSPHQLVQGLIAIQTILGLLPLTFAVAFTEIVASSYSTRIVRAIALDRRVWQALGVVVISLALDILILARPSLLDAYPLADLAVIAAVTATLMALWVTKELPGEVSPEGVTKHAVDRLDVGWASAVSKTFSPFSWDQRTVFERDPFHTVERLLARWAEQDDAGAFRTSLDALSRHINRMLSRQRVDGDLEYRGLSSEDEAAVDTYLSYHLGPLIGSSANRHRSWILQELLRFRWSIEPQTVRWVRDPADTGRSTAHPEHAPIALAPSRLTGPPLGARLYSRVLREAMENDLDEVAEAAAYRLGGLTTRAIAHLPEEERIPCLVLFRDELHQDICGEDETNSAASLGDGKNDDFLECLQHGLVDYMGDQGVAAARFGLRGTAGALARVLSSCVKEIHTQVSGVVLRRVLLRGTFDSIDKIAGASANQRLADATKFPRLYGPLQADMPQHQELAQMLAYYGTRIVTRAAQHGLLDYLLIMDTSMTALSMVKAYPRDTGRLVLAMHTAAEALRDPPLQGTYQEEAAWLRQEIYERIAQIRRSAGDARPDLDGWLGGMPSRDLSGEDLRQALMRASEMRTGSIGQRKRRRYPRVVSLLARLWMVLRVLLPGRPRLARSRQG